MSIFTPSTLASVASETAAAPAGATAVLPPRFGITMRQINDTVWRVSSSAGATVGHIVRQATADGDQFVAQRLLPRGVRYLALGSFWSIDDAVACFRS